METSHSAQRVRRAPAMRYGIRYEGHDLEVRFPGGASDAAGATVLVDGDPVAAERLTVRDRDIALVTRDGVEIHLDVAIQALDVLTCVRLRRPDGYWIDLEERGPA